MSAITAASITTSTTSSSVDRSGLTEDDVLTAKVTPLLDQIDVLTAEVAVNEVQISAYQEMQSLLQALETAVDQLSNPTDGTTNVFDLRTATLTSSDATAASSILSASIAAGTPSGTHTITVDQLATAERLSGGSQASSTAALDMSGSFTLGESSMSAATISITSGMSLSDVASAINKESAATGVTASIVTISGSSSDPQYTLLLSGADTDQTIDMSTLSGSVLSQLGLTAADGSTAADVLQAAQPAELTFDGISGIERSTNDITDLIDGVTLNLTQADSNATVTMAITADTGSIGTAIGGFVDAYNAWRDFVDANQATNSDGTAASTATLFGDSTLRDASLLVDQSITSFVGNSSLGAIGIALDGSNHLEVTSSTLETSLADDLSSVSSLFQYQATSSSADLTLANHDGATYSGSFTLDIETDGSGAITAVTGTDASGNAVDFTYSGDVISGAAGSAYAGLTFAFTGNASQTVSVTTSQGLADQLYATSDYLSNTSTGPIADVITGLQDEDSYDQERASAIQTQANTYAEVLLTEYGNLEASISEANQTYSILQELMSSSSSS
jgi:flagellar hook-associated protein 2